MVRAVALVGFYRGDLVVPGQVLDLPAAEFGELVSFGKVALAPPAPAAPAEPAAGSASARKRKDAEQERSRARLGPDLQPGLKSGSPARLPSRPSAGSLGKD